MLEIKFKQLLSFDINNVHAKLINLYELDDSYSEKRIIIFSAPFLP